MALSQTSVLKLYNAVIDDVIAGVRDAFLDEGVDEQVLQEMKQVWTNKLMSSKAVELNADLADAHPAPALSNSSKSNGTKSKSRPSAAAQAAKKEEAAAKAADSAAAAAAAAAAATAAATQQSPETGSSNASAAAPVAATPNTAKGSNQSNNANTNPQSSATAQQQATSAQQPPPLQSQSAQTPQQAQPPAQQSQPPPPPQGPQAIVANLHPSKIVPIQITLPPQPGVPNSEPRVLTIHVPASALQENQLHQVLTGPIITSIMTLPPPLASSVLQQHVNAVLQNQAMLSNNSMLHKQLDGAADTSDDEASDVSDDNLDGDDDDDLDKEDDEEIDGEGGAEEEPLNSDDDVSEEEQADLFDTDNVIVCQYDKITRSRNKWKFYLKDGIMNIGGKDYVFQKSNGDAEW